MRGIPGNGGLGARGGSLPRATIRGRMIWWFALLFSVIMASVISLTTAGLSLFSMEGRIDRERAAIFAKLKTVADLKASLLTGSLIERQRDVRLLADSPTMRAAIPALLAGEDAFRERQELSDFASLAMATYGDYVELQIVHFPSGRVLFSLPSSRETLTRDTDVINQADIVRKTHILDVHQHAPDDPPLFHLFRAILDAQGKTVAVLVLGMEASRFFQPFLLSDQGLGNSAESFLVNGRGGTLTPLKHPFPGGRVESLSARLAGGGSEGMVATDDYRGVPVLAAYRHIRVTPEWGWGLVVKIDQEEFFAPIRAEVRASFLAALAGIVIMLPLITLLARKLTDPLRTLGDAAARLTAGDFSARAGLMEGDEIGQLGQAFDQMAETIQRRMEASEGRFEAIFEHASDGILVFDAESYTFLLSNSRIREMTGYGEEALRRMTVDEIHPAEVRQQVMEHVHRMMASLHGATCEVPVLRRDGSVFHAEITSTPIIARAARIGVCFFRDTSERRAAQEALEASEARYRAYVDNAPVGIFVVDGDGRYVTVNQAACRMTGYEAGALTTMSIADTVPAELLEDGLLDFSRLKESGRLNKEITLLSQDGRRIPVILDAVAIGQGLFMGFCTDISQRRAVELALQRSQSQLQAILDNSNAVIFVKDRQGRFELVNRRYEEVFQVTWEEMVGRTDHDMWDKTIADALVRSDREVFASGLPIQAEEQVLLPDGRLRTYLVVKFPLIDAEGNPELVCGIATDISERARLEKELAQSRKMEAIGTLAGGIAHDFNNILSIVLGYGELGVMTVAKGTPVHKYFDEILQSARRARGLVKQLLAFSRRGEEKRQSVRPGPIIMEAMGFMRSTLPANIQLEVSVPELPGTILADPTQIHQLIMNLCTNSAHALTEENGQIMVTLERLELAADNDMRLGPGAYFQIMVKDTGTGIPLGIQERIFDPFFTTKEVGKGTGLGLAVVHGVVERYEGAIALESKEGEGATFRIFLPVSGEEVSCEVPTLDAVPEERGKGRILLVDDEPQILHVCKVFLEKVGYRTEGYLDPLAAFEAFKNHPYRFDAVISDQAMPGMTGGIFGKRVLELRPEVPFLLCTGFSETIDPEKARQMGFAAYLQKPVPMQDLLDTLGRVLEARDASRGG